MLTHARLLEVVCYDPLTGRFTWLISNSVRVRVGSEAGAGRNSRGYRRIQIDKRRYAAHVLAWFYMTGQWPAEEIDHWNRDTGDNRFTNLREATRKQNNENKRQYARSTPGTRGVYSEGQKWRASVRHNKRQIHLGSFDAVEDAQAARRAAEDQLFTHHVR